jgi:hypothetical protein
VWAYSRGLIGAEAAVLNSEDGTFCISPAAAEAVSSSKRASQSRLPTYMEVKALVFLQKAA